MLLCQMMADSEPPITLVAGSPPSVLNKASSLVTAGVVTERPPHNVARSNSSELFVSVMERSADITKQIPFQRKPGNKCRPAPVWSAKAICSADEEK